MSYSVTPIQAVNEEQIVEVSHFLAGFEPETETPEYWQKRLTHWWTDNPFTTAEFPLGWMLLENDDIVGFLGVIPQLYTYQNEEYPVMGSTTWRVKEANRNGSMLLFMQLYRFTKKFIQIIATPNDAVQQILEKMKYRSVQSSTNYFLPMHQSNSSFTNILHNGFQKVISTLLPATGYKVVTLNDDFAILPSHFESSFIQKKITKPYLEWYCHAPKMHKYFAGLTDKKGQLVAYVIMAEKKFRSMAFLRVIDYFATKNEADLLLGLVKKVCKSPKYFGISGYPWLVFTSFGTDNPFSSKKWLQLFKKNHPHPQYFTLPKALSEATKQLVIAEGDFGL